MLLIEVTDTRSGHGGQVIKGQHIKPTLIGPCDACVLAIFFIFNSIIGKTTIRDGIGYFMVKARIKVMSKKVKF